MRIGRVTFHLNPLGGSFWSGEETLPKKKALMMLVGGPIASLIWSAALLVIHKFVYASEIITFMFCCSFPQFVLTTIPMRYPACLFDISVSDGMQILRILNKSE